MRYPAFAVGISTLVLVVLALPALGLQTKQAGLHRPAQEPEHRPDLRHDPGVLPRLARIPRTLVVKADDVTTPQFVDGL